MGMGVLYCKRELLYNCRQKNSVNYVVLFVICQNFFGDITIEHLLLNKVCYYFISNVKHNEMKVNS